MDIRDLVEAHLEETKYKTGWYIANVDPSKSPTHIFGLSGPYDTIGDAQDSDDTLDYDPMVFGYFYYDGQEDKWYGTKSMWKRSAKDNVDRTREVFISDRKSW